MIETRTARRRMVLGYLAALGAAASYGSVALVGRKIVDDYSSPMVGAAFSLVLGAGMVVALFHRDAVADAPHVPRRAWAMVALAGCASTWGVSFWFLALSRAPVVLVAPLVGTSPLVSLLLAHLFLRRLERLTWRTVAGAMLVVGGVALITIGRQ
ncbi:MAG: DMT family transporter [Chloroflexi bacterium]|nr:DMT family transporter [Chloroflexota bacterium]